VPGTHIVHSLRGRHGGSSHLLTQRTVHGRGGALLDDLLVSPLDRAVPLEQRDDGAVRVGQDLHLDVSGINHEALKEDGAVAESRGCFSFGSEDGLGQGGLVQHRTHAPTATTGGGLDQQRVPDVLRGLVQHVVVRVGHLGPWQCGNSGAGHGRLGRDLGAHRLDRIGRRAHEGQAVLNAGTSEGGVLGDEPVAGMDSVGVHTQRGIDQEVGPQVGLGWRGSRQAYGDVGLGDVERVGVGVGVDGRSGDTHLTAGSEDPARDLASVGDHQHID